MKFKCLNCSEEYDFEPENNTCLLCYEDSVYTSNYVNSIYDWEEDY